MKNLEITKKGSEVPKKPSLLASLLQEKVTTKTSLVFVCTSPRISNLPALQYFYFYFQIIFLTTIFFKYFFKSKEYTHKIIEYKIYAPIKNKK
jgi:hypothetical protein